jgi:hypothetical protein
MDQMFIGTQPHPERMKPVENGDGDYTLSVKAAGGMWTSPYRGSGSAWLSNLSQNITPSYILTHPGIAAWRCTPKVNRRIYRIVTIDDLLRLLAEYGRTISVTSREHPRDWVMQRHWLEERANARKSRLHHSKVQRVPDFEHMAQAGWDAIWLTRSGYQSTRLSYPHLYGWDCECMFWLGGNGWPFDFCEIDRPIARFQEAMV